MLGYSEREIRENARLTHGYVGVKCPHCEKVGGLNNLHTVSKKLVYFVGSREDRTVEVANINCLCPNCKGAFRISNGVTIKRKKRFIEISSITLDIIASICFILGFAAIILPEVYRKQNDLPVEQVWNHGYIIFAMFTAGMCLSLLFMALSRIYPNVELSHTNKDYLEYIPTIYEKRNLQTDYTILSTRVISQEEKIGNQANELQVLRPLLTINDRSSFPSEKSLQEYIAENAEMLKFKDIPLKLYKGRSGVEFNTSVGRIDILLTDYEGNFYIIETKVDKIPDKTVGQISRYMGWVNEKLNKNKRQVYGLIIGFEHNQKLKYAVKTNPNIFLFEYGTGLNFKEIK